MRDAIARALTWVLAALTPRRRPGRHSAEFLTVQPQITEATPDVIPASPWSRPWTSATKAEAAARFRQQDADTLELHRQRERRHALTLATMGIDYPYVYPDAPFGPDAFATAGVDV
ncbi:hypothetical protein [Streptomyces acidiscabies]|uniref:hypothetical protein n=1 Tax=Streptomyces acidiscabies TaxID=42234 RepID=UPI000950E3DC|nr:hypothetical protein [Streptomyces acidiscabies]